MADKKKYILPELPYAGNALEPHITQAQLVLHHDKHHAAYVNGANAILERLDKARESGSDIDMKATLKELSFQAGGHVLHSLFWANLAPASKAKKEPEGALAEVLKKEFGSFERFKKEFTTAAVSTEGSGWAALSWCGMTGRPIIMQIEKHNVNVYPMFRILMVLDVWEHAYYLDYKNERAKFVEAFWNIVNWDEVNRRLEAVIK
jgi:Fe-Mn family superoxide dismutase